MNRREYNRLHTVVKLPRTKFKQYSRQYDQDQPYWKIEPDSDAWNYLMSVKHCAGNWYTCYCKPGYANNRYMQMRDSITLLGGLLSILLSSKCNTGGVIPSDMFANMIDVAKASHWTDQVLKDIAFFNPWFVDPLSLNVKLVSTMDELKDIFALTSSAIEPGFVSKDKRLF